MCCWAALASYTLVASRRSTVREIVIKRRYEVMIARKALLEKVKMCHGCALNCSWRLKRRTRRRKKKKKKRLYLFLEYLAVEVFPASLC